MDLCCYHYYFSFLSLGRGGGGVLSLSLVGPLPQHAGTQVHLASPEVQDVLFLVGQSWNLLLRGFAGGPWLFCSGAGGSRLPSGLLAPCSVLSLGPLVARFACVAWGPLPGSVWSCWASSVLLIGTASDIETQACTHTYMNTHHIYMYTDENKLRSTY